MDRLLLDDAGELVGAAVGDDEVTAHAVVVTTGGFGANSELIERYLPQTADAGDWLWYIGAPGSRGDALILGEQVGAQIAGEDLCQLMLTPNFGNLLEGGYFPGWLVLVNASGRRFFDESSSFSVTQPIVRAQKGPVWAIFDRGANDAAAPATAGQRKRPDAKERDYYFKKWVTPVLDEMIDKGVVLHAQTVEELAGLIGVPERNLAGTIERYNADFDAGADQMFFKSHALMRRVSDPPYYATELRLAHLSVTATGLRIDPGAHVLDEASAPIPGLLAAGECTGGVLGEVYVGNGNAYSNSLVFGRIAGAQAAERARGRCASRLGSPRKDPEDCPKVHGSHEIPRIQILMSRGDLLVGMGGVSSQFGPTGAVRSDSLDRTNRSSDNRRRANSRASATGEYRSGRSSVRRGRDYFLGDEIGSVGAQGTMTNLPMTDRSARHCRAEGRSAKGTWAETAFCSRPEETSLESSEWMASSSSRV